MKEQLCQYIRDTLLSTDEVDEVLPDDDLLAVDMLDSLQLMRLVAHIESATGKRIPAADLVLENFKSVNAIVAYLNERPQA